MSHKAMLVNRICITWYFLSPNTKCIGQFWCGTSDSGFSPSKWGIALINMPDWRLFAFPWLLPGMENFLSLSLEIKFNLDHSNYRKVFIMSEFFSPIHLLPIGPVATSHKQCKFLKAGNCVLEVLDFPTSPAPTRISRKRVSLLASAQYLKALSSILQTSLSCSRSLNTRPMIHS